MSQYLNYFYDICKIPHGSHNEKALSEYLINFAKEHNLKYKTDDVYNVIIYKNGTSKSDKVLALQAHIDMVDEKTIDSNHDFNIDPLDIYEEDGYLKASGTTLGADNGAGVAMILSVLADKTLKHPPLEAIFTVQEETTMEGAFKLNPNDIQARSLINLDSEEEGVSTTTSAGGIDVIFTKDVSYEENSNAAYTLTIGSLLGGHSGADIALERGNAIKLIGRIANEIKDIQLSNIKGGLKVNAIPRDASLTFVSSLNDDEIEKTVQEAVSKIKNELLHSDSNLTYSLNKTTSSMVLSKESSKAILNLLCLIPNGLRHRDLALEGLTTASENVGIVTLDDLRFSLYMSLRSCLQSYIDDMVSELFTLAEVLNFNVRSDNWYPAWDYVDNSPLRNKMCEVFKKVYGKEMLLEGIHAGLECGIFKNKFPDMDIITFGPNIYDCHSPNEKIELSSLERTYGFLIELLNVL